MHPIPHRSPAEAWLAWFEDTRMSECRAALCRFYGLEPADADALINTACWQVYRHWATVTHPVAYFWQTLRRAVNAQRRQSSQERQQQEVYAGWWRKDTQLRCRTRQQVMDILEEMPVPQRQLLHWFMLGYEDSQVAVWLETTPAAIRVRRHAAYCTLRARIAPPLPSRPQVERTARAPVRAC